MPEMADPRFDLELVEQAREAARRSYSPYSNFRVGAAIRANGRVFTGANIENASYGLTVCAERTAAFAAVLAGCRILDAIAVACVDAAEGAPVEHLMPCGACRQVLSEFANPNTIVSIDRFGAVRLDELLPRPFRLRPLSS